MTKIEELKELFLSGDGLLVLLRLGDGLDKSKFDRICCILKDLKEEWKNSDYIPKMAVDIFIDFYPAIESSYGLYNDEEMEEIIEAADIIMELIRDCVI